VTKPELDDDVVPAVFDCFIGGYMGTSYRVHLDGEVLVHETLEQYKPTNTSRRTPSAADWTRFWAALEQVGAWGWAGPYECPGVMDGTNWSVHIVRGPRMLAARGTNGYPPLGDSSEPGPEFKAFLKATSKLAGAPFR